MSLKLVILGSNGFVGKRIALNLLSYKTLNISPTEALPLDKIILFDLYPTKDDLYFSKILSDPRFEFIEGDLCNKNIIMNILDPANKYTRVSVIHLAALLSGNSETNFDLGMKVNLYGTLQVMDCLRDISKNKLNNIPQIYFYSSTDYTLAYNSTNKIIPVNEESFRLSPVSYGCQKACIEILVSDYTRKGFIDGRVGRYSAVIGKPDFIDVLSYAWHGVFSQTLQGIDYKCGLPMHIGIPCCSLSNVAKNTIYLTSKVDSNKIGHNRVVALPAISASVNDLWKETQIVAKQYNISDKIGRIIKIKSNEMKTTVKEIDVNSQMDYSKAKYLGLDVNVSLNEIITDFVETYVKVKCPQMNATKSMIQSKL